MRRSLFLVGGLVLAGVVGVAPAGAGASGDVKRFCRTNIEISQLFNEAPDPEEASPDELAEFQEELNRLLDRAEQTVPPEIADQVSSAAAALRENVEAAFEDPAVQAAGQAIDQWALDNCGYRVLEVTAREYEFEGIPKTLRTGIVGINLTNEGAELHEVIVVRIKGDESVEELIELPERQVEKKIEFAGAAFAAQGESGIAFVELEKPGRYAAVCLVPVGTTSPDQEVEGEPHAAEGMFREFRVKKK